MNCGGYDTREKLEMKYYTEMNKKGKNRGQKLVSLYLSDSNGQDGVSSIFPFSLLTGKSFYLIQSTVNLYMMAVIAWSSSLFLQKQIIKFSETDFKEQELQIQLENTTYQICWTSKGAEAMNPSLLHLSVAYSFLFPLPF